MHPRLALVLALTGALSVTSAQWLERLVYVADSVGGVTGPAALAYDRADNRVYVSGGGGWVVAVDAGTNRGLAAIPAPSREVWAMTWSPVTNKLYAASRGTDSVLIVDCGTNQPISTIAAGDVPCALAANTASGHIYVANWEDNVLTVIDGSRDSVLTSIGVGGQLWSVLYVPVGNKVYTATSVPPAVSVIDAATNRVIGSMTISAWPYDQMVYDSGRNRVYLAWRDTFGIIDCTRDSIVARVQVRPELEGIVYNPVADRVYLACYGADSVAVIDPNSAQVAAWIAVGDGPGRLTCNRTDNKVYCANFHDFTVTAHNADTGGRDWAWYYSASTGLSDKAFDVAVGPDGSVYACGRTIDSTVTQRFTVARVAPDGTARWVYADPSGPHGQFEEAREVAVSDDGRVYAAGWRDTGWPYDGDEAVVISLDTAGVVRWEYRYNPTPESVDVAEDIAVGPNGRVYAAGTSWSPGAGPDIILVCLDADPPGVAERPSRAGLHQTRSATIVRGILFLPSSLLSPHSSLLSIDGRKALDLVPGPNDVSRLAPGVYFVCSGPSAVSRQPTAVQKVVVTR